MKGLRNCTLAFMGACFAPVLIWVGAGASFYQSRKRSGLLKRAIPDALCAIDTDCPDGYICLRGRCVPAK